MADKKISQLSSASALTGAEPLAIVQDGVTKKTTVQDVAKLALLFPNGIKLIGESRQLQASDAGCILMLFENAVVTAPSVNPFSEGDYIGFMISAESVGSGFNLVFGAPLMKSYINPDANQQSELVIFNYQKLTITEEEETINIDYPVCINSRIIFVGDELITLDKYNSEKEQTIILGTVTYQDVNAADAITDIFFDLNQIPTGYYPEVIYQTTEIFYVGGVFADINSAGVQSAATGVNTNAYLDTAANTLSNVTLADYANVTQDYNDLQFRISFNDVNTKNLTAGKIVIKALIKKFPI